MEGVLSTRGTYHIIGAAFFISGVLSLIYEVTWVRMLSLFFGSDAYAASITLSVFMAGLALGSWLVGRVGDRIERPIVFYGVCEMMISISALLVPHALDVFLPAYRLVYTYFDAAPLGYEAFRVGVAVVILLIPTACMGATLPLLVRALSKNIAQLGFDVGYLYGLNLAGAFTGVLMAGFVLLPLVGVALTVTVAATAGLCLGILSIVFGYSRNVPCVPPASEKASVPMLLTRDRKMLLLIMAISGAAALALEVVWMRMLVQTFLSTAQVFSVMLACFLSGLGAGSFLAGGIVDRLKTPFYALIFLQVMLGASVAFMLVLNAMVPTGVSHFSHILATLLPFPAANMAAKFLMALIDVLVPSLLLGATFPVAVRAFVEHIGQRTEAAGKIYAWNTAGAIAGSLLGGFVLLPFLGTARAILFLAVVFLLNGLAAGFRWAWHTGTLISRRSALYVGFTVLCIGIFGAIGISPSQEFLFENKLPERVAVSSSQIIYRSDGALSTVVVLKEANRKTLLINAAAVAVAQEKWTDNAGFIFKSLLPLVLHKAPERVAVMGYGIGITARAAELYPGTQSVRIVELNQDVIEAQKYFSDINGDALNNTKVLLRVDDARNFMHMTDERFDMITTDSVHPRAAGVGDLYSREYYESISKRLNDGGFVLQWIPIKGISPESFDVALRTFVRVFPNTTLWYADDQISLLATNGPVAIDCTVLEKNLASPEVRASFPFIQAYTPRTLLDTLLMGPEQVRKYLDRNGGRNENTDDNSYLQYHIPLEPVLSSDPAAIVENLTRYAGHDAAIFDTNCNPYI